MSNDDIEHLKVNKIPPRTKPGRVHLSVVSNGLPADDRDEAWGGSGSAMEVVDESTLRGQIVAAIRTVQDPEIPLNLYDLGLIYGFEVDADQNVEIEMTLTAPACPVAGTLVEQVAQVVGNVAGVAKSHVKLVWDPPWTKDRMSDEALLELGLL